MPVESKNLKYVRIPSFHIYITEMQENLFIKFLLFKFSHPKSLYVHNIIPIHFFSFYFKSVLLFPYFTFSLKICNSTVAYFTCDFNIYLHGVIFIQYLCTYLCCDIKIFMLQWEMKMLNSTKTAGESILVSYVDR